MAYYVWLTYYFAAAAKDVQSDELCFGKKHVHGLQPTQAQIDSLQPSLQANVAETAQAKNLTYPGDAAVRAGRQVHTRSAH